MKIKLLLLLWTFSASLAFAKVKLPALISDGMVLQRDQALKIWGWADGGEKITINFNSKSYSVLTSKEGKWLLILPGMSAGGPYTMTIKGKNEIKINDILIGDVWLCSGQSNMAFKMERVKDKYEKEFKTSTNKNIRQFLIKPSWSFSVQEDVESEGWIQANPEELMKFTAVGYFFARNIYQETQIPVGIINASYSATVAEAWMSEDGLKEFPNFIAEANKYKDPEIIKAISTADKAISNKWNTLSVKQDIGQAHNGNNWIDPSFNSSSWNTLTVPGFWDKPDIKNLPGVVWLIKEIDIPSQLAGKDAVLFFGAIDDKDSTYFNGVKVGHSYMRGQSRNYNVPGRLVKAGKNRIIVRIVNPDGPGGFYPDKKYEFISGDVHIDLRDDWQYNVGAKLEPLPSKRITKFNIKPTAIFNSMIAPITNYTIKGVAWYQGEGNAGRAYEYRKLFSDLIVDWRNKWRLGDLPFIYVQLANYGKLRDQPAESSWAELREAQSMALRLSNTGMAVIHDIGETNDIHPLNKKTVGERLALAALKTAYNRDILSSGPTYDKMRIEKDKVIITFKNTGMGLLAKGGKELKYFAIAGDDKKLVWAKTRIENNSVVIWAEEVKHPVAVRYAWADNPLGANLYNKEGLPASSFRTDDWEGKTYK
ncbi:MAG: sialate O-acetylesterase [Pedobacter sp.]|uniref:sialate O-acetylesterase n=1 Tax=Pedobacter sp. TaxID=1411316 RepID=UPI0035656421